MATCIHVSEDREALFVYYASEPVLAAAAADLMRQADTLDEMLERLNRSLVSGIVEAGVRGELVARILILMGRDHACNAMGRPIGSAITVSAFLTALIGEPGIQQLDLPPELANGLMTFTHFIRITYAPTLQSLKMLLLRCGAAMTKTNQRAVDTIIPVVTTDNKMALVVFQVKAS